MFGGATAGGFQPGPTTGNTGTTGGSGGGGGDGLTESQVQTLIDTSLGQGITPSSVTTTGQIKASQGFSFDTSPFPDGSESSLERESNGGMLLKRGGTTFLTLSPFTGATFGTNVTATNLTVNGTFTPSGGISGVYTSSQTDTLLADKEPLIADGGLSQVKVTNLTSDLVTLSEDIAGKQSTLTSSSSVAVGTLTAATEIVTGTIKAPSGASVLLGNSAGTGLMVASSGAVGILKVPNEALDVYGSAAVSGTLTGGGAGNFAGPITVSGGDFYAGRAAIEIVDDGTVGSLC